MAYHIAPKVVNGNPCKTCGSDLRRVDSGLCAMCFPIKNKSSGNAELVKRRRAIEAHQHRNDPYY